MKSVGHDAGHPGSARLPRRHFASEYPVMRDAEELGGTSEAAETRRLSAPLLVPLFVSRRIKRHTGTGGGLTA